MSDKEIALVRLLLPDGLTLEIEAHWVRATCIAAAVVNCWRVREEDPDSIQKLIDEIVAPPGDPEPETN